MLKLVIADSHEEVRTVWAQVFAQVKTVIVCNLTIGQLVKSPDLKIDAILMPGIYAHERYGGHFIEGKSQILRTPVDSGMPPYVVTTPPQTVGNLKPQHPPRPPTVAPLALESMFDKIFLAIEEFNQSQPQSPINTLGFELELLNLSSIHTAYQDACAVKAAYEKSILVTTIDLKVSNDPVYDIKQAI